MTSGKSDAVQCWSAETTLPSRLAPRHLPLHREGMGLPAGTFISVGTSQACVRLSAAPTPLAHLTSRRTHSDADEAFAAARHRSNHPPAENPTVGAAISRPRMRTVGGADVHLYGGVVPLSLTDVHPGMSSPPPADLGKIPTGDFPSLRACRLPHGVNAASQLRSANFQFALASRG